MAVIGQALRDTLSYDRRIRDEALTWLKTETRDLNFVCEVSGLKVQKVIDASKFLEELGPREGVVYLKRIFERTQDEVTNDRGDNQD
jgi:hypothetical protein|tara:strand:+ start:204 stop:464 length:261 start_codon:yes stop_codon:yes gene_type:complete